MSDFAHTPVLLRETLDLLNLRPGMQVIDMTLGLGGHSLELLHTVGPSGKLLAFEQDEDNLQVAKERLKDHKNVIFVHRNFEHIKEEVERHGFKPDAILADLGLSSPHVDNAERGFAFKEEGPLDMRFDQRTDLTAADIINQYSETDLADIFYHYGEERRSRVIAKKVCETRKTKKIETTKELADLILSVSPKINRTHPATKVFQALRIAVNRELEVLETALQGAIEVLQPEGRIAVISYHSLEDRMVKQIFKENADSSKNNKYKKQTKQKECQEKTANSLYILTKRPIIPSGIEVFENPRSRSAKLRGAQKQ